LYENLNRLEEAERYYLKAIEKGHVDALNNLAILYKNLNRLEEAERYYLKAIEKGHVDALNNLRILYENLNRLEEAEKYYLKAIEKGEVNAFKNFAIYCWEKKVVAWNLMKTYIKNTKGKIIQDRLILLLISAWAKKRFFEENRSI